jgi:hypothetical protein
MGDQRYRSLTEADGTGSLAPIGDIKACAMLVKIPKHSRSLVDFYFIARDGNVRVCGLLFTGRPLVTGWRDAAIRVLRSSSLFPSDWDSQSKRRPVAKNDDSLFSFCGHLKRAHVEEREGRLEAGYSVGLNVSSAPTRSAKAAASITRFKTFVYSRLGQQGSLEQ